MIDTITSPADVVACLDLEGKAGLTSRGSFWTTKAIDRAPASRDHVSQTARTVCANSARAETISGPRAACLQHVPTRSLPWIVEGPARG